MTPLELWAGPECTVNRVGDAYRDQLEETGFAADLDNLDRLAALGIARMRLPLIWERTETRRGHYDWRWADGALGRLDALGVAPIAGLLHHGSGPAWTDLLDPAFPALVEGYAAAVADRYPAIDAWTPVNEPLTTARFSGLYGIWHPHHAGDASFVRALLNQVRATALAMRAVRRVNPAARLIQTEDLGLVTASPRVAYQARFENERRWLSFDLLLGRVDERHVLWDYLLRSGAGEAELHALRDAPCPPDILGVNSYLTSDRYLDERPWLYPARYAGGNGRHAYADVETVRVSGALPGGFEARLRETCARYGRPVAITEVHLGCGREEQLRWLRQAWHAALAVRGEGHDVGAVTCWASSGALDWDSLVTRNDGHYEPGLWDARSTPPRPTALAALARQLATGEGEPHPVLEGPGWWQRASRLAYRCIGELQALPDAGPPVLITGATGTLGRAFARVCAGRGLHCVLLGRADMDIADAASVAAALERWQPWAVVNAAGFVRVDDAESEPSAQGGRQWRENVIGPQLLATACARRAVRLVGFSSDLVFDGTKGAAYVESDGPRPLNAYGRGKQEAERRMLEADPRALVVRTAAFFGPWDRYNFVTGGLAALRRGEPWTAADDQVVSPTYVPDLARAALDLLIDGEAGVWHLANAGAVSWAGFALMAAEAAGLDARLVRPVAGASLGQRAPRPATVPLGSERGRIMPALADALARYLAEVEPGPANPDAAAPEAPVREAALP